jgi:hypothetical protein
MPCGPPGFRVAKRAGGHTIDKKRVYQIRFAVDGGTAPTRSGFTSTQPMVVLGEGMACSFRLAYR